MVMVIVVFPTKDGRTLYSDISGRGDVRVGAGTGLYHRACANGLYGYYGYYGYDKVSAVVSVLSTGTDVIYVDSDVYFCTAKAVENILHILYTDIDIADEFGRLLHAVERGGDKIPRGAHRAK